MNNSGLRCGITVCVVCPVLHKRPALFNQFSAVVSPFNPLIELMGESKFHYAVIIVGHF